MFLRSQPKTNQQNNKENKTKFLVKLPNIQGS